MPCISCLFWGILQLNREQVGSIPQEREENPRHACERKHFILNVLLLPLLLGFDGYLKKSYWLSFQSIFACFSEIPPHVREGVWIILVNKHSVKQASQHFMCLSPTCENQVGAIPLPSEPLLQIHLNRNTPPAVPFLSQLFPPHLIITGICF